jgi:hypothetical protein
MKNRCRKKKKKKKKKKRASSLFSTATYPPPHETHSAVPRGPFAVSPADSSAIVSTDSGRAERCAGKKRYINRNNASYGNVRDMSCQSNISRIQPKKNQSHRNKSTSRTPMTADLSATATHRRDDKERARSAGDLGRGVERAPERDRRQVPGVAPVRLVGQTKGREQNNHTK